jgi:fatty acid desaturase
VIYYVLVFQNVITLWLVLKSGKVKEMLGYVCELASIIAFHLMLWCLSAQFYYHIYLPALFLAWLASAVVLYMMHAVDAIDYTVHPTNTSTSPFFNRFGDNDGYHLEHSLFPGVHPLYLPNIHSLIEYGPRQILVEHYFIAGLKYLFRSPE